VSKYLCIKKVNLRASKKHPGLLSNNCVSSREELGKEKQRRTDRRGMIEVLGRVVWYN
jgi:hypothetical protein